MFAGGWSGTFCCLSSHGLCCKKNSLMSMVWSLPPLWCMPLVTSFALSIWALDKLNNLPLLLGVLSHAMNQGGDVLEAEEEEVE